MLSVNLQPLMDSKVASLATIESIKDLNTVLSSKELQDCVTKLSSLLSSAVGQLTAGGSSVAQLAGTAEGLRLLSVILERVVLPTQKKVS